MDTRVAGHHVRRPFTPSPQRHSTNRRFRIGSGHVKGAPAPGMHFVRCKNFFPLKLFFGFLIFFQPERRFLEATMTIGELFAVTTLISIGLMIAAYWQNDDNGGLI